MALRFEGIMQISTNTTYIHACMCVFINYWKAKVF